LILLVSIVAVATVWNILFYVGLSKKKVNASEGIIILMPLMTIVLSWLFTPQDFDLKIAGSTLAATLLVTWAYRPEKLLRLNIYTFLLAVSVVLMALENVLAGQLLQAGSISPAALYFVRTFVLFVLFYIYYRPSLSKLSIKTNAFLALSGLVGASAMVLRFYGLRDAGITMTAIILILVPVIVFSSAIIFLHEKMKPGRMAAMLVIGGLILYAAIINYNILTHN
jgi:drug/metabolite transporter (DMT)-like permease